MFIQINFAWVSILQGSRAYWRENNCRREHTCISVGYLFLTFVANTFTKISEHFIFSRNCLGEVTVYMVNMLLCSPLGSMLNSKGKDRNLLCGAILPPGILPPVHPGCSLWRSRKTLSLLNLEIRQVLKTILMFSIDFSLPLIDYISFIWPFINQSDNWWFLMLKSNCWSRGSARRPPYCTSRNPSLPDLYSSGIKHFRCSVDPVLSRSFVSILAPLLCFQMTWRHF